MARIFLDTNKMIDVLGGRDDNLFETLRNHSVYASVLSVHIFCYVHKMKIPNVELNEQIESFLLTDLDNEVLRRALEGPVEDFEDNVQLHSGAEAGCDIFLTNDKKLLQMKFFGKMKLVSSL